MAQSAENFFLIYLIKKAVLEVAYFFVHWYRDGFVFLWKKLLSILASLDYIFAVKITFRHWMEPLYQDRTAVGYILGPLFRTFRIIFGAYLYLLLFVAWVISILIWFAVPAGLVWGAMFGFNI